MALCRKISLSIGKPSMVLSLVPSTVATLPWKEVVPIFERLRSSIGMAAIFSKVMLFDSSERRLCNLFAGGEHVSAININII